MNNETKFKESMVLLGSIFKFEVDEAIVKTYWRLLQGISDEQFAKAVDDWLLQGKFFPKPSEILDMISTPAQSAGEAWMHVLKQLRDSQNASLTPAELKAVNEIGGIQALSRMDFKSLEFKGKEFRGVYEPDRMEELRERLDHDPKMKALGKLVSP